MAGLSHPFSSDEERRHAGCQHRLFFSQVEFCDNLIFHRRAALDKLGERLLDANRTIGQPNKITIIFGRKITKQHRGKLQTEIEDMQLPNPLIRSHSSSNTSPTMRALVRFAQIAAAGTCARLRPRPLQLGRAPLRPLQASRQRPRREVASLAPLPLTRQGLFGLPNFLKLFPLLPP
jgi:hypothetical protein